MKQQRAGDGVNFYRGYRQLVNSEKTDRSRRRARVIVPIALLAAALLCVAAYILVNNWKKTQELNGIEAEIAAMQADYDRAAALEEERNAAEERYSQLLSSRFMFTVHPPLTRELFEDVRACAGTIFNISAYAYNETETTLTVDASAASVNEVPKFVERLRNTELFERVQYTGYTSEEEQIYFCTVGCTLNVDSMSTEYED